MENGTGENIKKKDRKGFIRTELIFPICVFVLMIGMLLFGVLSVTKETTQKEQESLQNPVCCPLLFSGRCLSGISCVFKEALRNHME